MATVIEMDYSELTAIRQRMEGGATVVKITLNDGLVKIGRLIVPAKGTGPLAQQTPRVTGKLARSTFFQIIGGPGRQILQILQPARTLAGVFYGGFVREGTAPHEIRPVKAKALRWFGGEAGGAVFAMVVQHPGNQPNPYHRRTLAMVKPRVQVIVRKMGEKVTAYIAGRA